MGVGNEVRALGVHLVVGCHDQAVVGASGSVVLRSILSFMASVASAISVIASIASLTIAVPLPAPLPAGVAALFRVGEGGRGRGGLHGVLGVVGVAHGFRE